MATTREELIEILTSYAGDDYKESQDSLIASIVDDAIEEVRNTRYPFGYVDEDDLAGQTTRVLIRYPTVIRKIMEYHYDKIGKEGVTAFYEAGQTTSFEAGGTPHSFLAQITPIAQIL